jgi:hypothetical protein
MASDEGTANFNMAVATLMRIDGLLQKISRYALEKNFEEWLNTLSHLKREIYPYIKEKQFDKMTELFNELEELDWLKIIDGRKVIAEEKKVLKILDDLTLLTQKAMFDANILMSKKQEDGGFD